MSPSIQFAIALITIIVILQANSIVVAALQEKGKTLEAVPLKFMLKVHELFGQFDQALGQFARGYARFTDKYAWDLADRMFKVLGWILIAGTVRAIAHVSDHWLLRGLTYVIFAVLGVALAKPFSRAATTIRDRSVLRFKKPFLIDILIGLVIWFALVITLWAALSLIIDDITNFLPPKSDGVKDPGN